MALDTAILALIATAVEVVSGQLRDCWRHSDSRWSEHSSKFRIWDRLNEKNRSSAAESLPALETATGLALIGCGRNQKVSDKWDKNEHGRVPAGIYPD